MMTFIFKSHTGNLFEFILQENHDDVDVPWKPDGILYPPIILEELMQIIPPSSLELRFYTDYIPHFGFFGNDLAIFLIF